MTEGKARRLQVARLAVAGLTGLLVLLALGSFVRGDVNRTFSDLDQCAVFLLAAVNCALAARSSTGRLRVAWGGFAGACLFSTMGQAIWSWYELVLHTSAPFPGLSDVGYLGFPLGAVMALAVFPSNVSQADRRRMTLDGLMAASAIGLVSWATALGAVVQAGGDSLFSTSVSVAYPLTDIALLVVCIMVLSRSRAHRVPLAFVAAGLVLMAVADSGYTYLVATNSYTTGNPIDLGWILGLGMLSFASVTRGATVDNAQTASPSVAGTFLPYVPLGGAIAFLAWQMANRRSVSSVETVLAAVIVLLVLLRQFLTVRDNQLLARALAERENELRHQAFHDPLTGLPNRSLLFDRFSQVILAARRAGTTTGLMVIDLDRFKEVNDTFGHHYGDELLAQIGPRLRLELRESDTVARLGGDEFAVLLPDISDLNAAMTLASKLRGALERSFRVEGVDLDIEASVGLVLSGEHGSDPATLLRRADIAMYVAKAQNLGVSAYDPARDSHSPTRLALLGDLRRAVNTGQLMLQYQPKVSIGTGEVVGAEALVRWQHPDRGLIMPDDFIPLAEHTGLIGPLTTCVLDAALTQARAWMDAGRPLVVSVNLSARNLLDEDLPQQVRELLAANDVPAELLALEVTESALMNEPGRAKWVLENLSALGVRLSIDDFGAGYTSLGQLKNLPVAELKIDKSFVINMHNDPSDALIVQSIIDLGHNLGLSIVAEGVETAAALTDLTAFGCDLAQGYFLSRPVTPTSLDRWMASRPPLLSPLQDDPTAAPVR
jgi:diguanylate cyclase (GGDEF)-like protein